MTITNKRIKATALALLEKVADDINAIEREIACLSKEIEMFVVRCEDAKWAGDTEKVNSINYQIMLKRTMRAIMMKRHKMKMKEMSEAK